MQPPRPPGFGLGGPPSLDEMMHHFLHHADNLSPRAIRAFAAGGGGGGLVWAFLSSIPEPPLLPATRFFMPGVGRHWPPWQARYFRTSNLGRYTRISSSVALGIWTCSPISGRREAVGQGQRKEKSAEDQGIYTLDPPSVAVNYNLVVGTGVSQEDL